MVSALFHKPSGFLFVFNTELGGFNAIREPGREHRSESKNCKNWDGILDYFVEWTSILKREINTPDLWEVFKTTGINFTLEPSTTELNSGFTPEEQGALTTQLIEIETYIQTTYALTTEQLNIISHNLDLLRSEVGKLGRDTWKYTAIGIIFTIITALGIPPEQGQILWHYITGKLSEVITNIHLAIIR